MIPSRCVRYPLGYRGFQFLYALRKSDHFWSNEVHSRSYSILLTQCRSETSYKTKVKRLSPAGLPQAMIWGI
jgi:hypothetical protein